MRPSLVHELSGLVGSDAGDAREVADGNALALPLLDELGLHVLLYEVYRPNLDGLGKLYRDWLNFGP